MDKNLKLKLRRKFAKNEEKTLNRKFKKAIFVEKMQEYDIKFRN